MRTADVLTIAACVLLLASNPALPFKVAAVVILALHVAVWIRRELRAHRTQSRGA